jgi:signal-transduction protein with cAMP-binding, CBS, and nucleotidyltransferase domain
MFATDEEAQLFDAIKHYITNELVHVCPIEVSVDFAAYLMTRHCFDAVINIVERVKKGGIYSNKDIVDRLYATPLPRIGIKP